MAAFPAPSLCQYVSGADDGGVYKGRRIVGAMAECRRAEGRHIAPLDLSFLLPS